MRSSTRGILAVLALVVAGGFLAAGRNRSFTVYYAKPATAPSATQTSLDPPSQAVEIEPTPVVPEEKKNTDDDLGMDDINLDDVSLDMDLTAPIVPTPPPTPPKSADDLGMDEVNLDDVSLDMDLTAPISPSPTPGTGPSPADGKLPAPSAEEDQALTAQAITGSAEGEWVADTTRETSVTELGMIEHATTGGVARTNGLLHLTGKKACPT